MTTTEAINAIGSRFKVKDFTGMPDDHIRQVTPEGVIIGDFTEALAEDCRFIQPPPPQFAVHYRNYKGHVITFKAGKVWAFGQPYRNQAAAEAAIDEFEK